MDQERNEVRQVETARARVADDVRSVAENANVVERAKENVQGRVSDVRDRLQNARDTVTSTVSGAASNAASSMRNMNPLENPVAMMLGGLAIGFLIGMVLPVSRFETERIGPLTDDMKERMQQAKSEVVRRGSEVIKETIESARETATSSLREQARDMGIGSGEQDAST